MQKDSQRKILNSHFLLAMSVMLLACVTAASPRGQAVLKMPPPGKEIQIMNTAASKRAVVPNPPAGQAAKSLVQAVENGRKIKAVGTVKGTIYIKNVSGNNLGDFGCRNLIVHINPLGGNPPKWRLSRIGTGDFSTRKCSYSIQNVPSAESFGISLRADFPNACDQKVFKADAGFPTKIKTGETLTYNLGVSQISCTLAK